MTERHPDRAARRLVRLYPQEWRRRFGDEFEQLLVDEMQLDSWSSRRGADVVAHAVLARLTTAGLAGRALAPGIQAWRAIRTLGVVAVVFLLIGVGIWSQMAVGWAWASPTTESARVATGLMSGALLGLSGIGALACLLVIGSLIRQGRHALGPLLAVVILGATLWAGCAHFAAQWPGGASSGWAARSIVPAQLGRIGWAGTLWISAYWSHPATLLARPAAVLAWMVLCPLLLASLTAAGIVALRRVSPSARLLRALAWLGAASVVLAALFVAGAAAWILSEAPGPRQMFQPGSVDDVGLAFLTTVLLAAAHIARTGFAAAQTTQQHGDA